MTKNETPSLFAALLVALLANSLLRGQTGYWSRAGLLMAPVSAVVLACVGWAFARCWRLCNSFPLRWLFTLLLLASSMMELLRLWQLSSRLYPDGVTLAAICLMVLLPVIYLRRVSAISQTANVVLCLVLLAAAAMVLSIASKLRAQNLQITPLQWPDFAAAAQSQWVLYPEFLLPALWPEQEKRGAHTLGRLAAAAIAFDVGTHLVLELFFGAAMPGRSNPVHAAAQCGTLSIFNRLEWLQLLLWTMVVSLKLALYLYAMIRLCGGKSNTGNTAVGLDRFPLYFAGMLLLCVVFRKADVAEMLVLRNGAAWCFAALVGIGGVLQWLFCARPRPCR